MCWKFLMAFIRLTSFGQFLGLGFYTSTLIDIASARCEWGDFVGTDNRSNAGSFTYSFRKTHNRPISQCISNQILTLVLRHPEHCCELALQPWKHHMIFLVIFWNLWGRWHWVKSVCSKIVKKLMMEVRAPRSYWYALLAEPVREDMTKLWAWDEVNQNCHSSYHSKARTYGNQRFATTAHREFCSENLSLKPFPG